MVADALGIPDELGAAGAFLSPDGANGAPFLRDILRGLAGRSANVATRTALKALTEQYRVNNLMATVCADGSRWIWNETSEIADTSENLVIIPDDAPDAGRWLRMPGAIDVSLAFTYATTNGATLLTVPTGALLWIPGGYWEVSTLFSGGTSSAIGLSSSAYSTAGDLLGGASGDAAAVLGTTGIRRGTIGAAIAAGVLLKAADTVLFNRITSAFTAGVGKAHLVAHLLANPGA
ncbi:hypothetical protein EKK58_05685 [Candidatus Dependentiae bacterium]|nr:MAG: hypothetical protein EKK58_05685 [Candidatus Dependentiae bacterium]